MSKTYVGYMLTLGKAYADSGDMAAAESPEKKHAMYLFNCAQRAHGKYVKFREDLHTLPLPCFI